MSVDKIELGRFIFYVGPEVFEISDYRECLLLQRGLLPNDYLYYVNLHKDSRFPEVEFRFPPDEKKLSEEEFKIKLREYQSFEHRKDYQQPTWKLHISTFNKVLDNLRLLCRN